ncbi:helix-turn-helix transcriptional regulator [Amphibacillus jilinensis]|uniref:helix-turn-helix transcriptional regulator n=1 Tax=Amphibacillus jilinensis TaxID=1216008 RepID=UPI0002F86E23|nr:helix-turn-helix transcriptional regulator [Amphibacillus jilinensis]
MSNLTLFVARRERKLKQVDLAEKLGISKQSYYRKENGLSDFTQTEMVRLAKIFGCTLNDLFWKEALNNDNINNR